MRRKRVEFRLDGSNGLLRLITYPSGMRKRRSAASCHSIGRVVPPETPANGATRVTLPSPSSCAPDSKNGGDGLAGGGEGRGGARGGKKGAGDANEAKRGSRAGRGATGR